MDKDLFNDRIYKAAKNGIIDSKNALKLLNMYSRDKDLKKLSSDEKNKVLFMMLDNKKIAKEILPLIVDFIEDDGYIGMDIAEKFLHEDRYMGNKRSRVILSHMKKNFPSREVRDFLKRELSKNSFIQEKIDSISKLAQMDEHDFFSDLEEEHSKKEKDVAPDLAAPPESPKNIRFTKEMPIEDVAEEAVGELTFKYILNEPDVSKEALHLLAINPNMNGEFLNLIRVEHLMEMEPESVMAIAEKSEKTNPEVFGNIVAIVEATDDINLMKKAVEDLGKKEYAETLAYVLAKRRKLPSEITELIIINSIRVNPEIRESLLKELSIRSNISYKNIEAIYRAINVGALTPKRARFIADSMISPNLRTLAYAESLLKENEGDRASHEFYTGLIDNRFPKSLDFYHQVIDFISQNSHIWSRANIRSPLIDVIRAEGLESDEDMLYIQEEVFKELKAKKDWDALFQTMDIMSDEDSVPTSLSMITDLLEFIENNSDRIKELSPTFKKWGRAVVKNIIERRNNMVRDILERNKKI